MAVTGLLDTNVVLYLLGGKLATPLPVGDYGVSVITEMELLSWPSLTDEDENLIEEFLSEVEILELTAEIRKRAVKIRRDDKLKLPDAIVCATALEHNVVLWTNDTQLTRVPEIVCQSVELADESRNS
jgi:predicted nucleic acid-binding protein